MRVPEGTHTLMVLKDTRMETNVKGHEDSKKEAEKKTSEDAKQEKAKEPTMEEQVAALKSQVASLKAQLSLSEQKIEEEKKTIDQLGDKAQDWQDKFASMQRYASTMAADMKRMQGNTALEIQHAKEKMLKELLPILDDFEVALKAGKEDESKDFEKMVEGVQIISDKMFQHLSGHFGLKKMATDGETFDPDKHEALQVVKDKECKEKRVAMTYQSGYMLDDKVLRPAKVVVKQPDN